MAHPLKAGQTLWYDQGERYELVEVKVRRVGRKYVYAQASHWWREVAFDLDDLCVADHERRHHGRLFLAPEDREAHRSAEREKRARHAAWYQFKNSLPWTVPDHLTAADIERIQREITTPTPAAEGG